MAVAFATLAMPWWLKRIVLNWVLGYELDRSARIGFSVVAVAHARMGRGARIRHLTLCRGLQILDLGEFARIGNLNWISGSGDHPPPRGVTTERAQPMLTMGAHSAVTNRHYIDCSDHIDIGAFTTIAGFRSQLLTHSIDTTQSRQQARPLVIGKYCFVGTGCILLGGGRLPDRSVLGAGSVLRSDLKEPLMLYAGVPAKATKRLSGDDAYFRRPVGYVE